MDDKQLIRLLKEDNHTAFTKIYELYADHVASFSALYVNSEFIDEVVQEVFIKLWLSRVFIDEQKNLKGYLFIITRNLIFDKFRKQKTDFYKLSLIAALEEASEQDIEEELSTSDLADFIDVLVDQLPPRCKEVFTLSRQENLTNKEIATQLNISIKSVEAAITRALKHLREHLYLITLF